MPDELDLATAVRRLAAYLSAAPLTETIAHAERHLDGLDRAGIERLARERDVDDGLMQAAVVVRRDLGRLNDLIHAAAILLVLPRVLRDGERLVARPSLAAGNDPTRPYDVETNLRIAEFKLSGWKGADAARKRQVFKDLVHLAADSSGREAELFVVGAAPVDFLRRSRSTAAWALNRFPTTQAVCRERFGALETPIADFTAGAGSHVHITDIAALLPDVGLR